MGLEVLLMMLFLPPIALRRCKQQSLGRHILSAEPPSISHKLKADILLERHSCPIVRSFTCPVFFFTWSWKNLNCLVELAEPPRGCPVASTSRPFWQISRSTRPQTCWKGNSGGLRQRQSTRQTTMEGVSSAPERIEASSLTVPVLEAGSLLVLSGFLEDIVTGVVVLAAHNQSGVSTSV